LPDRRDQDLRELFRGLRAEEERCAPRFDVVLDRVRTEAEVMATRSGASDPDLALADIRLRWRHRSLRRIAWGGGLLVAAAVTALLLIRSPATSDARFVQVVEDFSRDPASGAWRSPTDGLLNVPGSEILTTVPIIQTSRWMVAPLPSSRRNPS
jgi:hypothetical protein